MNEQYKNIPVADAEGIAASYNLHHQASVTSLQIGAEGVDIESIKELLDVEVHDHSKTAIAEQKAVSPKKVLTTDDTCYFCENNLFYCHHVISCISTVKKTREDSRRYRCLDLSVVYNFSEANVTAFDIRQLLSPVNDPNCEHACQLKSEKEREIMKLNFDLDFSIFEQCLFEDDLLPAGPTDNMTHYVAVSKVGHEDQVSDIGQKVACCAVSVNDSNYRNSDLLVTESRNDAVEMPETEIKLLHKSHSSVSPGRFNNTAITPPKDLQIGTNCFHEQMPTSVLVSPVSPILGSVLKRHASESPILGSVPSQHVPESPVFGAVPKNLPHNHTRSLPICSTPKMHKKSLFSGNIMLEAIPERESDFTAGKAMGDKSPKTVTAGNHEQQLNSCVSEIQAPPRPNFDLFSGIQWHGNLEHNGEHFNSKDRLTDTTMLTVTQLLDLVDKDLSTAVHVGDSVLPCEAAKKSKPVQARLDVVPHSCVESHTTEHTALKDNRYPDPLRPFITSISTSVIRNSIDKVTSSSCSEQKSEHKTYDHDYLHDDADDFFANLSVDCHIFSSKENTSSVTSPLCAMDNVPEAETCSLGKSDKSKQYESGREDDPAGTAPEITQLPISSVDDYNQLATTIIKPPCSDMNLKHKLTDFANDTCTGHSSVETVRNTSKISSSADPRTVYFDNKNSLRIMGDEKQYKQVSTPVTDKQKEISKSVNSGGRSDLLVSRGKESISTCTGSISHGKIPVDDDSPVVKPLRRNRKINISSTSDESLVSSPYRPQNRVTKQGGINKCNSLLVQDSSWLTARRSNLDTSLLSLLEEDDGDTPQILADMKKHNNNLSGKRHTESCIPVRESDVVHISSDDDFESQSLRKWKKRSQSECASKSNRNGNQRKTNPVNRKLKVCIMLHFFNNRIILLCSVAMVTLAAVKLLLFRQYVFFL